MLTALKKQFSDYIPSLSTAAGIELGQQNSDLCVSAITSCVCHQKRKLQVIVSYKMQKAESHQLELGKLVLPTLYLRTSLN